MIPMGLNCNHRYPYKREVQGDLAQGSEVTWKWKERFEDAVLLAMKMGEGVLSQGT